MLRSNKIGWTGDDLSWRWQACYNEETSAYDCSFMWVSLTTVEKCVNVTNVSTTCPITTWCHCCWVALKRETLWELEFIPRKKKSSKTESEESKRHSNSIIAIIILGEWDPASEKTKTGTNWIQLDHNRSVFILGPIELIGSWNMDPNGPNRNIYLNGF